MIGAVPVRSGSAVALVRLSVREGESGAVGASSGDADGARRRDSASMLGSRYAYVGEYGAGECLADDAISIGGGGGGGGVCVVFNRKPKYERKPRRTVARLALRRQEEQRVRRVNVDTVLTPIFL